jgi:hypothetical protein
MTYRLMVSQLAVCWPGNPLALSSIYYISLPVNDLPADWNPVLDLDL